MESLIFTRTPAVFEAVVERFGLRSELPERLPGTERSASNGRIGAVLAANPESAVSKALGTFEPERIHFAGFANAVSTECRAGDVVLPNAFFEFEPALREADLSNKEAMGKFGANALFLETYEMQGDYDFGEFGLSVGGTCVSSLGETEGDDVACMRSAYVADVRDDGAYAFVSAVPDDSDAAVCVSLSVVPDDSEGTSEDASRLVSILAFLEDSFGGEDSDDGDDGDGEEDDEFADDDFSDDERP